jgi:hypothetical protein
VTLHQGRCDTPWRVCPVQRVCAECW